MESQNWKDWQLICTEIEGTASRALEVIGVYRAALDKIYNDGEEGRRLVLKYVGTLHPR
jgi:hypothetical protein